VPLTVPACPVLIPIDRSVLSVAAAASSLTLPAAVTEPVVWAKRASRFSVKPLALPAFVMLSA
jgi:hypothetical protein